MTALAVRYGTHAETKKKTVGGSAGAPVASGTFELGTSRTTVEIGFKAKYLTVLVGANASAISTYNADISTTLARYSGANTTTTRYTMSSDSTDYRLHEVTDTGFSVNKRGSSTTSVGHYYAIGYAPGE